MLRPLRIALSIMVLAWLGASGTRADAFALYPFIEFPSFLPNKLPESLPSAARWVDGFGLEDGIQVGVEAGFEANLGITAPDEVALVRATIVDAIREWENPVLHFDITFDATVVRGAESGFEIDLLAAPNSDPIFGGEFLFGLAWQARTWSDADRPLTNGMLAPGWIVWGGDVFINSSAVIAASVLLQDNQERLDALQRLVTHEVGHVLGLGHPNFGGFDTDLDPYNAMPIDPADPYADLFWQYDYDETAVMASSPCGGGLNICPVFFVKNLQPDDIAGLDALYPVLGPPATTTTVPTTTTSVATTTTTTTTVPTTTTSVATTTTTATTVPSTTTTVTPPPPVVGDIPMCKITNTGVEKTRMVPPEKVQRSLDRGLTPGECLNPTNGQVLCKVKRGKRVNVLLPDTRVQRAMDKGFFTLGACSSPTL